MNKKEIIELQKKAYELIKNNDLDNAFLIYKSIIDKDPKNDTSYHMIGFICLLKKDYINASKFIEKAISLYKWSAEYYNTLASVYKELYKYEDAIKLLTTSIIVNPNCAESYNNLGMIYSTLKKFNLSFNFYEKALEIDPQAAFIHFNYAIALLANGNYEKGWEEYEWRHKLTSFTPPPLPNINDVKNKRILLQHEQGFGDNIQFIRYAKILKENGAKEVNVIVSSPLEQLFKTCPWVDQVNTPTMIGDYLIPMMSLPFIFKTNINTIPTPIPYFEIPSFKLNEFNIGLAWTSNKNQPLNYINQDGDRILPSLSALACQSAQQRHINIELFRKINCFKLWCLQPNIESPVDFVNYPEIKDFYDTAKLIGTMDLVISIDTAVAHLAGALGKKVYLLLPFDSEWRWRNEENSSWYPSVKIFRQSVRGDWQSVIDKLYNQIVVDFNIN